MLSHATHLLAQSQSTEINSVLEMMQKGGIMMIPIGLCSLIVVAVAVERAAVLRAGRIVPKGFRKGLDRAMDSAEDDVDARRAGRAYCKDRPSPAANLILAGLEKLGHSGEVVEKHMAAAGEDEVYLMRRRLRALVVVSAIAPLLGLTGTIFGMIRAFQTVASSADTLGRAELLAEGIYEAMISTAAGLLVAMPALVIFHWLTGRVERCARELDRLGVVFMERYVLEPMERAGDVLGRVGSAEIKPASVSPREGVNA